MAYLVVNGDAEWRDISDHCVYVNSVIFLIFHLDAFAVCLLCFAACKIRMCCQIVIRKPDMILHSTLMPMAFSLISTQLTRFRLTMNVSRFWSTISSCSEFKCMFGILCYHYIILVCIHNNIVCRFSLCYHFLSGLTVIWRTGVWRSPASGTLYSFCLSGFRTTMPEPLYFWYSSCGEHFSFVQK